VTAPAAEILPAQVPDGTEWPDPDTLVLLRRALRPGTDAARLSRLSDDRWSLDPAVFEDHAKARSLNFALVPQALRLEAKHYVLRRGGRGRGDRGLRRLLAGARGAQRPAQGALRADTRAAGGHWVTRRAKAVVRWREQDGTAGELPLRELTTDERMLLFTEGPHGLEPLWLWLSERGMPFAVHSWEGVFRAANQRCERPLAPPGRTGLGPHQVLAPYATPHSARRFLSA
jgi:hypothetical protein